MEHRLISTPVLRIYANPFSFPRNNKANSGTELFVATPCFISLSSHWRRGPHTIGRLDERNKLRSPKIPARVFRVLANTNSDSADSAQLNSVGGFKAQVQQVCLA
jgi:hypothetical protein